MTTQTKDLPPLPKPAVHAFSDINESFLRANHYTADQMHEYALEAIRASATSAPEQPNQWRALCWDLAKALNCLPSTFPDANGHLLREAKRYAALACKTCNGHGLIGGMTREGGESHDCPDCNRPGTTPQPAENDK